MRLGNPRELPPRAFPGVIRGVGLEHPAGESPGVLADGGNGEASAAVGKLEALARDLQLGGWWRLQSCSGQAGSGPARVMRYSASIW